MASFLGRARAPMHLNCPQMLYPTKSTSANRICNHLCLLFYLMGLQASNMYFLKYHRSRIRSFIPVIMRYHSNHTRPDISYQTHECARFAKKFWGRCVCTESPGSLHPVNSITLGTETLVEIFIVIELAWDGLPVFQFPG